MKSMDDGWRNLTPTPEQVDAHAEQHTFRRYEKDDPDDEFVMPAFGLWAHRNTGASIEPDGYPIIVLLRREGDRIECETRAGDRDLPEGGEWRPLKVNVDPAEWPEGTR